MNVLLIIYSGQKSDAISEVQKKFPNCVIELTTKSDLKMFSFKGILDFLRKEKRDAVVIFCENILTQSQLFNLKMLGVLTKSHKKMITDKVGHVSNIYPIETLFVGLPLYLISSGSVFLMLSLINLVLLLLNILPELGKKRVLSDVESKNKFNIAYLRTDDDTDEVGGRMAHISGFGRALVGLNHELFFVSSGKISGMDDKTMLSYIVEPFCFFNRISHELSQVAYNIKFVYNAYSILKKHKPDILYHRYSTFNFSGTILSFLTKKPLILEFNSSALWKTEKGVKHRFKISRFLIERLNLNWANIIVVVSAELKRKLIRDRIDERKVIINTNGADPEFYNPAVHKKDLRSIYGINKKYLVGFAGMFGQWHGVETLVSCIKHVVHKNGETHFILIGDGILRDKLEQIAKNDGTLNFVTFTGIIPKKEMACYLNACDILVSPHRNMADGQPFFGSPIKLFEYMAMGKPIVASKVGQLEDILENERNALLVPPDDPVELAKAILRLVSDGNLGENLGRRARIDLINNYTWEHNVKRVIEAYKNIIH